MCIDDNTSFIFLNMRNFSDKICSRKSKHLIFNNCSSENSAVYVVMWKNIVQPHISNIIRRMRFECCIVKATDTHTHRVCNIYFFSTTKTVTRTRLNITCVYIYCLPVLLLASYVALLPVNKWRQFIRKLENEATFCVKLICEETEQSGTGWRQALVHLLHEPVNTSISDIIAYEFYQRHVQYTS